ncbi:MAG: ABC transporter permease [Deltaproteobacteria bacterium]|nr:ABC transporter permease [Deltaproteobacteria bacterium]
MGVKRIYEEYQRPILGLISLIGLVAVWEFTVTYVIEFNPFFFTKPSHIATATKELLLGDRLWRDLAISSRAFLWGFTTAVIVGIPMGAVMGWRTRVEYTLDPFFTALYASPLVALAPLIILIFGVGLTGKAVLVFLLAVFPFIFNTYTGVKSTDQLLINVVRAFGGKERHLYVNVILPSTLPFIVAGARLAIGRGIVGVIVGEFYAASEGIGFAIAHFGDTYRLPEMFVGIIILSIIAVLLTEALRKFELIIAPYRAEMETR